MTGARPASRRRRHRLGSAIAFLLACGIGGHGPAAAMVLGVQTHFSQGWPISLLDKAKVVGAPALRDSYGWQAGERERGRYDFSRAGHIDAICRAGFDLLVVLNPLNPLYGNGGFVRSPEAQAAFASYVGALLDRFPCIVAVEIGNEINGAKWYSGDTNAALASSYVQLVRTVRDQIKPRHPKVALLGASTISIGTGFIEDMASAGLLEVADGVVVHPYRKYPEGVDRELAGLRAAMERHGGAKPIWATEFGDYYKTPELAPPHLIKMVSMMAAAGVERAYWYALIDQRFFRNMGLFDGTRPKPAAAAFKLAERLLSHGEVTRVPADSPLTYIYRFGPSTYVMWGAPRAVSFDKGARLFDPSGKPLAGKAMLGDTPIVAENVTSYAMEPSQVVADSLLGSGADQWSYWVRKTNGQLQPLRWTDWRWTSRYVARGLAETSVSGLGIAAGRPVGTWTIQRYTSPEAQKLSVAACFDKSAKGDGLRVRISKGSLDLFSTVLTKGQFVLPPLSVSMAAGETLDFAYSAVGGNGGNTVKARLLLSRGEASVPCP
jgi:hypothetical protein